MQSLLLSSVLLCLPVKIINTSGIPWNKDDDAILTRAKYVCGNDKRYTDTPCVGMIHKKEERHFLVLCTYKRELSTKRYTSP